MSSRSARKAKRLSKSVEPTTTEANDGEKSSLKPNSRRGSRSSSRAPTPEPPKLIEVPKSGRTSRSSSKTPDPIPDSDVVKVKSRKTRTNSELSSSSTTSSKDKISNIFDLIEGEKTLKVTVNDIGSERVSRSSSIVSDKSSEAENLKSSSGAAKDSGHKSDDSRKRGGGKSSKVRSSAIASEEKDHKPADDSTGDSKRSHRGKVAGPLSDATAVTPGQDQSDKKQVSEEPKRSRRSVKPTSIGDDFLTTLKIRLTRPEAEPIPEDSKLSKSKTKTFQSQKSGEKKADADVKEAPAKIEKLKQARKTAIEVLAELIESPPEVEPVKKSSRRRTIQGEEVSKSVEEGSETLAFQSLPFQINQKKSGKKSKESLVKSGSQTKKVKSGKTKATDDGRTTPDILTPAPAKTPEEAPPSTIRSSRRPVKTPTNSDFVYSQITPTKQPPSRSLSVEDLGGKAIIQKKNYSEKKTNLTGEKKVVAEKKNEEDETVESGKPNSERKVAKGKKSVTSIKGEKVGSSMLKDGEKSYEELDHKSLRDVCSKKGLVSSGSRKELMRRLRKFDRSSTKLEDAEPPKDTVASLGVLDEANIVPAKRSRRHLTTSDGTGELQTGEIRKSAPNESIENDNTKKSKGRSSREGSETPPVGIIEKLPKVEERSDSKTEKVRSTQKRRASNIGTEILSSSSTGTETIVKEMGTVVSSNMVEKKRRPSRRDQRASESNEKVPETENVETKKPSVEFGAENDKMAVEGKRRPSRRSLSVVVNRTDSPVPKETAKSRSKSAEKSPAIGPNDPVVVVDMAAQHEEVDNSTGEMTSSSAQVTSSTDFKSMNRAQLRFWCKKWGVSTSGYKEDTIQKLEDHQKTLQCEPDLVTVSPVTIIDTSEQKASDFELEKNKPATEVSPPLQRSRRSIVHKIIGAPKPQKTSKPQAPKRASTDRLSIVLTDLKGAKVAKVDGEKETEAVDSKSDETISERKNRRRSKLTVTSKGSLETESTIAEKSSEKKETVIAEKNAKRKKKHSLDNQPQVVLEDIDVISRKRHGHSIEPTVDVKLARKMLYEERVATHKNWRESTSPRKPLLPRNDENKLPRPPKEETEPLGADEARKKASDALHAWRYTDIKLSFQEAMAIYEQLNIHSSLPFSDKIIDYLSYSVSEDETSPSGGSVLLDRKKRNKTTGQGPSPSKKLLYVSNLKELEGKARPKNNISQCKVKIVKHSTVAAASRPKRESKTVSAAKVVATKYSRARSQKAGAVQPSLKPHHKVIRRNPVKKDKNDKYILKKSEQIKAREPNQEYISFVSGGDEYETVSDDSDLDEELDERVSFVETETFDRSVSDIFATSHSTVIHEAGLGYSSPVVLLDGGSTNLFYGTSQTTEDVVCEETPPESVIEEVVTDEEADVEDNVVTNEEDVDMSPYLKPSTAVEGESVECSRPQDEMSEAEQVARKHIDALLNIIAAHDPEEKQDQVVGNDVRESTSDGVMEEASGNLTTTQDDVTEQTQDDVTVRTQDDLKTAQDNVSKPTPDAASTSTSDDVTTPSDDVTEATSDYVTEVADVSAASSIHIGYVDGSDSEDDDVVANITKKIERFDSDDEADESLDHDKLYPALSAKKNTQLSQVTAADENPLASPIIARIQSPQIQVENRSRAAKSNVRRRLAD